MRYEPSHTHDEWVQLPDEEIQAAWREAKIMRSTSVRQGDTDKRVMRGSGDVDLYVQALGNLGERAVAKHLGLPRPDPNMRYHQADLPFRVEPRVMQREYYGTRIRHWDAADTRVIHVEIIQGCERLPYRLPGWITAGAGRANPDWEIRPYGEGESFFSSPQSELDPLSSLRALLLTEGHLAPEPIALPRIERAVFSYCERHHTYWCPCVRPHLYADPFRPRPRGAREIESHEKDIAEWSG